MHMHMHYHIFNTPTHSNLYITDTHITLTQRHASIDTHANTFIQLLNTNAHTYATLTPTHA